MMATSTTSTRHIFPFLDLPAELRNPIYEYLLHHDRANGRFGAVNILRTCRKINKEAQDFLYMSSNLTFTVATQRLMWWNKIELTRCVALSGDLRHTIIAWKGSEYQVPPPLAIYDAFPKAILKVERISIELQPGCRHTMQKFIYALACFLSDPGGRCLKLHLNIKASDLDACDYTEIMYYGLVKMPQQISVLITGDFCRYHGVVQRKYLHPLVGLTYLKESKVHPLVPIGSRLNTIAEYKRVNALIASLPKAAPEPRSKSATLYDLHGKLEYKCRKVYAAIARGDSIESHTHHPGFNAWLDHELMCDLKAIKVWATAIINDIAGDTDWVLARMGQALRTEPEDRETIITWLSETREDRLAEHERHL